MKKQTSPVVGWEPAKTPYVPESHLPPRWVQSSEENAGENEDDGWDHGDDMDESGNDNEPDEDTSTECEDDVIITPRRPRVLSWTDIRKTGGEE